MAIRKLPRNLLSALVSQGYGTRRECWHLVKDGLVKVNGEVQREPEAPLPPDPKLQVGDLDLPFLPEIHLAFHKPPETECSHTPGQYRSVFAFFPPPFVKRGIQSVGRLDADTSGLLFLTDSGPFNHLITSPKRHV